MKKTQQIYTMEDNSATKGDKIVLFAEMQMGLETVIQSEVKSERENKYCILKHICEIQKNGTGEPIYKAEIETQTQMKFKLNGCAQNSDLFHTTPNQMLPSQKQNKSSIFKEMPGLSSVESLSCV